MFQYERLRGLRIDYTLDVELVTDVDVDSDVDVDVDVPVLVSGCD